MTNGTSKTRTRILTLAAAVAVLAPTLLLAGPGRGDHGRHGMRGGHGHAGMGHHGLRQLDLSEEQREQIHRLMEARRGEGEAARQQLHEAREALAQQVHAETLDEAGIRAASRAVAALEEEQAVQRARLFQEVRKVLTPEQLAQWETLQQERMERREEHRERWQERRENRGDAPAEG